MSGMTRDAYIKAYRVAEAELVHMFGGNAKCPTSTDLRGWAAIAGKIWDKEDDIARNGMV